MATYDLCFMANLVKPTPQSGAAMASAAIHLYCTTGMSLALPARAAVRVTRGRGLRILCESGTVWISEERCRVDHVLGAGDTVRLGGNRDIVLSGLPDARVAFILEPSA